MSKKLVVQKADDGQDVQIKTPSGMTFSMSKELAVVQIEGFKIAPSTAFEAVCKALDGQTVEVVYGRRWSTVNTIVGH